MKLFILVGTLVATLFAHGQQIDLAGLRNRCIPDAPLSTLQAIVSAESGRNVNAIQVDFPKALLRHWGLPAGTLRLRRQPKDAREALDWIGYFNAYRIFIDVGLMQVSTAEAARRHIPVASLLEPCMNVRTGWQILQDAYNIETKIYGPGQAALRHAISRYNTGDTERGIDNGYLGRVMSVLRRAETSAPSHRLRKRPLNDAFKYRTAPFR
jgi:type IV secretion system protein VirB1